MKILILSDLHLKATNDFDRIKDFTKEMLSRVSVKCEDNAVNLDELLKQHTEVTNAICAIVGGIPEFSYPEGLSTGEVTVKFEVSDSVKENTVGDYAQNCEELQGIKRFNVFKYFEDTNMLLPIETFHDEEQGIV